MSNRACTKGKFFGLKSGEHKKQGPDWHSRPFILSVKFAYSWMQNPTLSHFAPAQLTAGGVNIAAKPTTHRCADTAFFQYGGKGLNGRRVRTGKIPLLDWIDRDEVNVDGHGLGSAAQAAVKPFSQLFGLSGRVVLPSNEGIFEGNSPAVARQ